MSRKYSVAFAAFSLAAVAGLGGAIASAALPDGYIFNSDPYPLVDLQKTDRVGSDLLPAPIDAADLEEATVEWVIDCYDQYGPEGARPDAVQLNRCMPS